MHHILVFFVLNTLLCGIETYHCCEGVPSGLWKDTQYRPIPWPLTQAIPFPIEPRLSTTGSLPAGASNVVCRPTRK
jgi:hypothetical protein